MPNRQSLMIFSLTATAAYLAYAAYQAYSFLFRSASLALCIRSLMPPFCTKVRS